MSHTPPASNNPYQAYPNAGTGTVPGTGNVSGAAYPQSSYQSNSGSHAPNSAAAHQAGSDAHSAVGPAAVSPYSPNLSPHFTATTGLLALMALFSLYEATHRVIYHSNPYGPWDGSDYHTFPTLALLIGGIWQAILSLFTLFIALWALLFDWHSVALTTIALGTQMVGWYTVVVFALAEPAFAADRHYNPSGQLDMLENEDQNRASYIFGWLFPLLAIDTAILAGLIFLTVQLLQIQMNNVSELHSPFYYAKRLKFFAVLQLLYGVSTIIYSAIFLHEKHDGQFGQPQYFYPNLTMYAVVTLLTGIFMTFVGLMGLVASMKNNLKVSNIYIGLCWLVFLWIVGAHIMLQAGVLPGSFNQSGYALAEVGVFLGTLLIGMYLAYKSATIETVHRGNYVHGPKQREIVV